MLDQGGGVVHVRRIKADADAGADVDLAPVVETERRRQLLQELFRHHGGPFRGGRGFQQEQEFVAAQAGQGVALPQAGPQALGHGTEQAVPGRMAEAVIDVLEAVQVEEEHGTAAAFPGREAEGMLQAGQEQGAVGQVGQGIVVGQVQQLLLGTPDR